MIVKVNEKEYRFDGYVCPLNSIQKMADAVYEQGRADVITELKEKVSHSAYNRNIQMISMELLWEILREFETTQ